MDQILLRYNLLYHFDHIRNNFSSFTICHKRIVVLIIFLSAISDFSVSTITEKHLLQFQMPLWKLKPCKSTVPHFTLYILSTYFVPYTTNLMLMKSINFEGVISAAQCPHATHMTVKKFGKSVHNCSLSSCLHIAEDFRVSK